MVTGLQSVLRVKWPLEKRTKLTQRGLPPHNVMTLAGKQEPQINVDIGTLLSVELSIEMHGIHILLSSSAIANPISMH